MKMVHILVDIDPTRSSQPALTKAITLAKIYGASLELLIVDYNSSLAFSNFLDNELLEKAKVSFIQEKYRWLDKYRVKAENHGIKVNTSVKWHKPIYEGIIDKALDCKADLVVKSTHRHPKINKVLFTPNDWQLLKSCPIPLLLVKSDEPSNYHQIMAAVDPTRSRGKPEGLNKAILDATLELSQDLALSPHVTNCYESISMKTWQDIGQGLHNIDTQTSEFQDYLQGIKSHHEELFRDLIIPYHFKDKNTHLEMGAAHRVLPELVKENGVDLVVLGTTYRSGLLGSTAEKLLDKVDCDILAVKKEGFSPDLSHRTHSFYGSIY